MKTSFATSVFVALAMSSTLHATQYSIEELPHQIVHPVGINAKAEVLGTEQVYDPRDNSFMRPRCNGVGPNCSVKLAGINDYSVVAGVVQFDDPNTLGGVGTRGSYWQTKISPQPAPLGGNGMVLSVAGLSNSNDFVGHSDTRFSTAGHHWFLQALVPDTPQAGWFVSNFEDFISCVTSFARYSTVANAVNDSHRVVGSTPWAKVDASGNCRQGTHPFINNFVGFSSVDDLLAGDPGGIIYYATANAVNNTNDVVGDALPQGAVPGQAGVKAVLYRGGGITYLGTLQNDDPPGYSSSALAINDYGEIVGWSDFSTPETSISQRAFVSNGVGMSDLASLINPRNRLAGKVVLTHANAINCNGWIVADGYEVATKKPHGYLLKPQPQPVRADCLNRMAYPDRAPIVPDPAP